MLAGRGPRPPPTLRPKERERPVSPVKFASSAKLLCDKIGEREAFAIVLRIPGDYGEMVPLKINN